jgi:hypothetical protein
LDFDFDVDPFFADFAAFFFAAILNSIIIRLYLRLCAKKYLDPLLLFIQYLYLACLDEFAEFFCIFLRTNY